jgi:hypothetical protein
MGALRIHGASTAKVNLLAEWIDPVDDPNQPAPGESRFSAPVDELPLPRPREGYLLAPGKAPRRRVGYYDPENDQIAMVRSGDHAGRAATSEKYFTEAAPKHEFGDTRRHQVRYTAVAASRYREYFAQDAGLDFTRTSEPVLVDVPCSERPLAPGIVYVVPTFGWQRQSDTNMKRSVRFGGGLRVYLERGWFSSGVGELLGVALWNYANGALDDVSRDKFKPVFTQWGMDPIWQSGALSNAPAIRHFPDAVASDTFVSLEEASARISDSQPGRVDVVGFAPQFDEARGLWFADLTIDLAEVAAYSPFVRLALVRYQPHALDDARISRVVLAGFAQLTPDRSALVTADPHHPRTLRVVSQRCRSARPGAHGARGREAGAPHSRAGARAEAYDHRRRARLGGCARRGSRRDAVLRGGRCLSARPGVVGRRGDVRCPPGARRVSPADRGVRVHLGELRRGPGCAGTSHLRRDRRRRHGTRERIGDAPYGIGGAAGRPLSCAPISVSRNDFRNVFLP